MWYESRTGYFYVDYVFIGKDQAPLHFMWLNGLLKSSFTNGINL